jgi:AbrB family looped-hinge helix DNA binding protein
MSHRITLGDRGRLVLPADIRRRLDLHPGDEMVVDVEEPGSVRLVSRRALAKRDQGAFADLRGSRSLVDELLADRRREVQRDLKR